jgi:adenylate cyclase
LAVAAELTTLGEWTRGMLIRPVPDSLSRGFRLGDVEVRPDQCVAEADGRAVRLEPKAMEVLLALAEAAPNLVSREALVAKVWPRGYVTDDALNRCISNLRAALGDNARSPEFIVTVPRRGYRLAQPVRAGAAETDEGLLVLPFQDLSPGADDYVADALTELLIARLSNALHRPVISRTTAMSFRNAREGLGPIGRRLGVRWFVEGSVLQIQGRVQIVAQLIDGSTDAHVWAETWTREPSDLLTILNEISRLVASQLRGELEGPEPPAEIQSRLPADLLREYLHGVQLNSRRSHGALRQAIDCFARVLEARPDHVPSLSATAASYFLLAHYGAIAPEEGFRTCRQLARRALEFDPRHIESRVHLAAIEFHHDWNFAPAEQHVRDALARNANLEIAWLLLANILQVQGRPEAAQRSIDRALEIDPLNTGLLMNAGDHLILQHRFGEAVSALHAAVDIDKGFRPAWLRLSLALAFDGRDAEARECLEQARQPGGKDAGYFEYLAIAEGRAGKAEAARHAAGELETLAAQGQAVLPWSLARAWAAAGEADRAIDCLRAALAMRSSSMPFLGVTPVFDSIRHLEGVQEVMRQAGL